MKQSELDKVLYNGVMNKNPTNPEDLKKKLPKYKKSKSEKRRPKDNGTTQMVRDPED
eukprot:CAMPEP_0170558274 /NCGR_PEP_ID=MMETSP0211-20121228/34100_1 /TAXON_ID=311385 /ORGANISM="Pseudokeronopsis sp., Strain OXSARD2" /LENGTH=56 /DNA_ID=CAMNT_0010870065 /DNA_START=37 /DNA_END=207 /DNA_ORIENTATION=+